MSEDNKWSQPKTPPAPLFTGQPEKDFVKQVNDELIERVVGQTIVYYPISLEHTNFHDLYGEAIDKSFLNPVRSLKELNLYESSLIFFTSDNGGIRAISNQYPLRAGKGSYYEGGIKVPLIIKWPNMSQKNTVSYSNVSQLDFFPTILDVIKNDLKPNNLDGTSLKNHITNSTKIDRDLFFHFPIYLEAYSKSEDQGRDPLFRTRPGSVIVSNNWKLHHYFEDNKVELDDLKNDPSETINLTKTDREVAVKLFQKLKKWRKNNRVFIPSEPNPLYDYQFDSQ